MYNMMFGRNPNDQELLDLLGIEKSYRYRDIYLREEDDKMYVILYSRQGGGNRECTQEWEDRRKAFPEGEKSKDGTVTWYSQFCYCSDCTQDINIKTFEDCEKYCNGKSDYQRNNETYYMHELYIDDKDDNFDSTYNRIRFDITSHPKVKEIKGEHEEPNTSKEAIEQRANEMISDHKAGRETPANGLIKFLDEITDKDED